MLQMEHGWPQVAVAVNVMDCSESASVPFHLLIARLHNKLFTASGRSSMQMFINSTCLSQQKGFSCC